MIDLDIIFEDDDIIAVNKPANLLTIPDRYNKTLPSLSVMLKERCNEIYTLHRLDFGTSGIILFAKNAATHSFLSDQINNRTINKFYNAVLQGNFPEETMQVDIPLLPNPGRGGGVIPSIRGKKSITIFNVEQRFINYTLVKVQLLTGRLHQIRAHAASIGFPLLVDELYGNKTEFYASEVKKRYNLKKGTEERPIISRPTLHSKQITFIHPSNKEMTLEAEYPKDFKALLQILSKYACVKE